MKFLCWNVNGLRACLNNGFMDFFNNEKPDFLCLQEIKLQEGQVDLNIDGYEIYYNYALKKGYSGTAIITKHKPINVYLGMHGNHNDEGRLITLEYDDFYLVTIYSPNSKEELKRLDYRMEFEDDLRDYLGNLKKNKNVIVCGDLNVAHNEIDLKNPKTNTKNPGFSIEERTKFTELLNSGYIDTFRYLYPTEVKYSWWSYRFNARVKNAGWRIDYFLVSEGLKDRIVDAKIHDNVYGSDHCPVELLLG